MAYSIPDGGICQVRVLATQDGQMVMNVLHYQLDNAGGVPNGKDALTDMLTQFEAAVIPKYQAVISDELDDIHVVGQWIIPQRYVTVPGPGGNFQGLVMDPALPPNDQVSITLRGQLANRHNIGRKAVFGVPRSSVVGGLVTGVDLPDYQDLGDELCEDINGAGAIKFHPIIFNRNVPGNIVLVETAQAQSTIRVERRRTVGVGA